jgi:hypothetical protein
LRKLSCWPAKLQILRRRGASYGDGDPDPGLAFKLPIGFHDLFAEKRCVHRLVYDLAGLGGLAGELPDLALVNPVEKPVKLVRYAVPR